MAVGELVGWEPGRPGTDNTLVAEVGPSVGVSVGFAVNVVGSSVLRIGTRPRVGFAEGTDVGTDVGITVGIAEGTAVGDPLGGSTGESEGN